jgi:hypothetical protein
MTGLKNIVNRILREIKTRPKQQFAHGMEHQIYPSKANPNRLFKVGDEGVTYWVKVFNSAPNSFAKIFRTGKLQDGRYYAEIEKLNTERVMNEWQQIENSLEELGIIDYDGGTYGRDITDIYMNHGEDPKIIGDILERLKKYNKNSFNLFAKYLKIFKDCEKAIEKIAGHETVLDAHRYNFGYDSNGKLKCFDI